MPQVGGIDSAAGAASVVFSLAIVIEVFGVDTNITKLKFQGEQHFLYFLPLPHGQGSFRPIGGRSSFLTAVTSLL